MKRILIAIIDTKCASPRAQSIIELGERKRKLKWAAKALGYNLAVQIQVRGYSKVENNRHYGGKVIGEKVKVIGPKPI